MRFWIIYNLAQISFFGRLLKSVLASVFFFFFNFSPSANHGGQHFHSASYHEKASYGPNNRNVHECIHVFIPDIHISIYGG